MKIIGGVVLMAVIMSVAACQRDELDAHDVCGVDDDRVCHVPFEVVYSHRILMYERDVGLDGVLVVGVDLEPPGATKKMYLLFPSSQRARICNPVSAIRLVPASDEIADELSEAAGGMVSIVGRMKASNQGYWGEMLVSTEFTLIESDKEAFECMAAPPPVLPPLDVQVE